MKMEEGYYTVVFLKHLLPTEFCSQKYLKFYSYCILAAIVSSFLKKTHPSFSPYDLPSLK